MGKAADRTRSRSKALRRAGLWALAMASSAASPAFAGAWLMQEGRGQAIVTWTQENASEGFDHDGEASRTLNYAKEETSLYAEYGLTARWTLIAQTGWQTALLQEGGGEVEAAQGFSGVELGARRRLAAGDYWVVSAQASAFSPGQTANVPGRSLGFGSVEAEARLLAGGSGRAGFVDGFADLQAGYRWRSDERDDLLADLTLGAKYGERVMVMAQSLNRRATGDETASFLREAESAVHVSAVVGVGPLGKLQIGRREVIAGRSAVVNDGWFFGVWNDFEPGPPQDVWRRGRSR